MRVVEEHAGKVLTSLKNNRPASRLPSPVDKPLPPRPVAQLVNTPSPTKNGRTIIDASEQPLRKALGTTQEEEWKALSPERKAQDNLVQCFTNNGWSWPVGPTEAESSEKVQADSVWHSSPLQSFSDLSDEYMKPFPLRTSSLSDSLKDETSYNSPRTLDTNSLSFTDHVNKHIHHDDERPHSPAPLSFSQPHVRARNNPRPANPHATASRIPIHDPKRAPQLVNIRSKSLTGSELPKLEKSESILSFGGQRLNSPEALEALDHGLPERKQSGSSKRTVTMARTLIHQGSVMTMQSSKRVPDAIVESGPSKGPCSTSWSSNSSSSYPSSEISVKHISGQLLSSSFSGSTLMISKDADAVLLGKSSVSEAVKKADASLALASSGHAGAQSDDPETDYKNTSSTNAELTVDVAANTTASSGNTSLRTRVQDLLNQSSAEDGTLPDTAVSAQDPETQRHITAALFLLEGTAEPPEPTDSEIHALNNILRERCRQQVPQGAPALHPAHRDEKTSPDIKSIRRGPSGPSGTMRGTTTTLPQYTPQYTERVLPTTHNTRDGRQQTIPSSMPKRMDTPPKEVDSIGFPSRIPSKASAILGPAGETRRSMSRTLRTPGSPPNPVSQFSTSTDDSKLSVNKPTGFDHKRKTTHSQSKSKAVIHNIKGLFTGGKREHKAGTLIPPVQRTRTKVTPTGSPIAKAQKTKCVRSPASLDASNKAPRPVSVDEVSKLREYAFKLIEEGRNEVNAVKKEQMLTLAAVVTNAISSAKEAELSMHEAKRAADMAHHSYQMTQCSLAEMGRLMAASHNIAGMPGLIRRLATRTVHR